MRLSISNIAWPVAEDAAVAGILAKHGVDAIDVAPSKYFPAFAQASRSEIAEVRARWAAKGVEIVGIQALLWGTDGLNLFAGAVVQDAMLEHLGHVCRIAEGLGARLLVFGSPRNRDRRGLADEEAMEAATVFFRRLGDIAYGHSCVICLEPNPPVYGANFMTDLPSTAAVVRSVDHPAIRMQLDIGALTVNGEEPAPIMRPPRPLSGPGARGRSSPSRCGRRPPPLWPPSIARSALRPRHTGTRHDCGPDRRPL